jgi:hypothetical protein
VGRRAATMAEKIAQRTDRSGGPDACHPWIGALNHGKPTMCIGGRGSKTSLAPRRIVWELSRGTPPPKNRDVEVTCRNSLCVNPAHLECAPLEEKFWRQVDKSGGPDACWPWTGLRQGHRGGYGKFYVSSRKPVRAHRYAVELVEGHSVPYDLVVMHLCDNPPCCNPAHLRVATQRENHDDMIAKGRHPLICTARQRSGHLQGPAKDE